MALDFSIPVYAGGYDMAAEGMQTEILEIVDTLFFRVPEPARRAVYTQIDAERDAALDRGDDWDMGYQYALEARLKAAAVAAHWQDDMRYDVARIEELRARMAREFRVVA